MAGEQLIPYSPQWAPHVTGTHTRREPGEDQKVTARCAKCGAEMRRTCSSGMPRQWIDKFALVHLHRAKLAPMPLRKP